MRGLHMISMGLQINRQFGLSMFGLNGTHCIQTKGPKNTLKERRSWKHQWANCVNLKLSVTGFNRHYGICLGRVDYAADLCDSVHTQLVALQDDVKLRGLQFSRSKRYTLWYATPLIAHIESFFAQSWQCFLSFFATTLHSVLHRKTQLSRGAAESGATQPNLLPLLSLSLTTPKTSLLDLSMTPWQRRWYKCPCWKEQNVGAHPSVQHSPIAKSTEAKWTTKLVALRDLAPKVNGPKAKVPHHCREWGGGYKSEAKATK